jgi:hypothetical protein
MGLGTDSLPDDSLAGFRPASLAAAIAAKQVLPQFPGRRLILLLSQVHDQALPDELGLRDTSLSCHDVQSFRQFRVQPQRNGHRHVPVIQSVLHSLDGIPTRVETPEALSYGFTGRIRKTEGVQIAARNQDFANGNYAV